MLKNSLYQSFCVQRIDKQRLQLEEGFRKDKSLAFHMRCRAVLLKTSGLKSTGNAELE